MLGYHLKNNKSEIKMEEGSFQNKEIGSFEIEQQNKKDKK